MSLDVLFHQDRLSDVFEKRKASLVLEIQTLPASRVLAEDSLELQRQLVTKYFMNVPELFTEQRYAHPPKEVRVDVSNDPTERFLAGGDGPIKVSGLEVTIVVPFTGDADLFRYRPSTMSMSYPRGKVVKSEVWLTYLQLQNRDTTVDQELKRDLAEISQ